MLIKIMDPWNACSTLLMGDFEARWCSGHFTEKDYPITNFCKTLLKSLEYAKKATDDDGNSRTRGYYWTQFTCIYGSTIKHQVGVEKYLKELGFSRTRRILNDKNNTLCTGWLLDIPALYEALQKHIPEEMKDSYLYSKVRKS